MRRRPTGLQAALLLTLGLASACGRDPEPTVLDTNSDEPSDATSPLFEAGQIAAFEITLSPAAIASLELDPKQFVIGELSVTLADDASGQTPIELAGVGVRLKGSAGSLRTLAEKPAFLLEFSHYIAGQQLLGLDKLALNNMVQDPSMQRELLGYRLFRVGGVPAPRTAHAVVSVNGEPYGLYATVESVDNHEFLDRWFGSHDSNLYEGGWGSDLELELITTFDQDNGSDVGFADLAELAAALDAMTDPASFVTEIRAVIDLDLYLKMVATDLYLGNPDGYAWARNNYFVIRRPSDMRWVFMPWGIDRIMSDEPDLFGGSGRVTQMCTASLECRILLAAEYQAVVARVEQLGLADQAQALADALHAAAKADPRREYDLDTVEATVAANIEFLRERGAAVIDGLICTDPSTVDDDGDGYNGCGQDCDDQDPSVHPGAQEVCDLDDDNCDGQWDNDPGCPQCVSEPLPAPETGQAAFCFSALSWADAEAACVGQGGHLLSVHGTALQDFAVAKAFETHDADWWIGLEDQTQEGTFAWTDGTALDFTAWGEGEPNDAGNEDCGTLGQWSWGAWNDRDCAALLPYVCRLP